MKDEQEVTPYECVQERGKFKANGYIFDIYPVYFEEESDYWSDNRLSLYLQGNQGISDEELARHIVALFQIRGELEVQKKLGKFGKMKLKLVKLFKKDYRYYSDSPSATGLVKWIEKKVKYKGKNIKFYDLERKYGLTKMEIAKMYRYMENLSGF